MTNKNNINFNLKKVTLTLKYLILMSFLSSMFGCKQANKKSNSEIFPKEEFAVVETKFEDLPAVGNLNFGYKNYSKKEQYPWSLKIGIALNEENVYKNGLPKLEESQIVNKFEDDLIKEIQKLSTAHYIGHFYSDTFLDIYIYLDNPEKVNAYLQTQINKKDLVRGFGYEINKDPNWKTVDNFLK